MIRVLMVLLTVPVPGLLSGLLFGQAERMASVKDYGAVGDGKTDDLPAIRRAFAAIAGKGQQLFFPAGTYGVSGTVTIPTKTQIAGVGRGDPGGVNTVIQALPSFPMGGTVVEMGAAPGPGFGVQVDNMTILGAGRAGICLANRYSQEQSFGRHLILGDCVKVGLLVEGAAMNSGPFEDLEILNGVGPMTNRNTLCVQVRSVGGFRGIRGLTCNAGSYYSARPAVALAIDGTGVYQDIHVEHFAAAVTLGSTTNSADTLIFADGQFGPDVDTGLIITAAHGINNQNLTILGLGCSTCTVLLRDEMTGTKITDTSVGWYLLGNGYPNKAVWTSNYGIQGQIFAPFRAAQVQLTPIGPRPACSASTRGTFWFEQSPKGTADHVEVCSKSAADKYSWAIMF